MVVVLHHFSPAALVPLQLSLASLVSLAPEILGTSPLVSSRSCAESLQRLLFQAPSPKCLKGSTGCPLQRLSSWYCLIFADVARSACAARRNPAGSWGQERSRRLFGGLSSGITKVCPASQCIWLEPQNSETVDECRATFSGTVGGLG